MCMYNIIMCICIYVRSDYIHVHMYVHVCMYVCTCTCMYVNYVCTYVYICMPVLTIHVLIQCIDVCLVYINIHNVYICRNQKKRQIRRLLRSKQLNYISI